MNFWSIQSPMQMVDSPKGNTAAASVDNFGWNVLFTGMSRCDSCLQPCVRRVMVISHLSRMEGVLRLISDATHCTHSVWLYSTQLCR